MFIISNFAQALATFALKSSLKALDDFYEVSGLKLYDKKLKPFGLELIVETMEYQLLEEILNGLNTK